MNITDIPTLEKVAALHLAIRVCYNPKVRQMIMRYETRLNEGNMCVINQIISSFQLPKTLHRSVEILIKPVIVEISAWVYYMNCVHNEVAEFFNTACPCLSEIDLKGNLRWQTVGLIDKHLTSQSLIRDERLDPTFRFVLACYICSETDVLKLWQKLASEVQRKFLSFNKFPLVHYWIRSSIIKGAANLNYNSIPNFHEDLIDSVRPLYDELPKDLRGYFFGTYGNCLNSIIAMNDTHRIYLVMHSRPKSMSSKRNHMKDNLAALKHFLPTFDPVKRQKLLSSVADCYLVSNELLAFCLPRMSDIQMPLLPGLNSLHRVLSCLLNFPWQESFLVITDRYWDKVTKFDLMELISYIIEFKIEEGWQDFDYVDIIQELWGKSSLECKAFLIEHCPKIKEILNINM